MAQSRFRGSRSVGIAAFGSVFFVIGLGFFLFMVLPMLYEAQRMQAWYATDGELLALDLHSNYSSDGTTYRVSARYRYWAEGEYWYANRVSLSIGSDNIGDYQRQLFQRLNAGRPGVTVWYDPDNPGNAILDRSLRWEMLAFMGVFVITFGGVGLGLMIYGLRRPVMVFPSAAEPAGLRQQFLQHNSRPVIYSGGMGMPLTLWILVVAGALFFVPGAWNFREGLLAGDGITWFMWVMVIITLGFAFAAVLTTLEYRRYGRLALMMDPFPGAIGGEFGAMVQLRERFDSRTLFPINLSCVHLHVRGSGRNRSQQRTTVWHQEGFAQIVEGGRGTQLAIRLQVPAGLPPSSPESNNYHAWYLNLEANVPGIDLNRQFTVPMFPGTITSRTLDKVKLADESGPIAPIPDSILRVNPAPNGSEFYYRMGRHKLGALITGLTAAGFGAGVFFALQESASGWLGPGLFILIFGILAVMLGLAAFYMLFNGLKVTAGVWGISTERRLLGLLMRRTEIARSGVQHIEAVKELEIQGRKPVIHYRLVAHTQDGRKVTVGESLRGIRLADRVTDMLYAALDLKRPK